MRPQKQHIIFFNNNSKDFNLDTNNKFNNSWLKKLQSRRSPPAAHLQQPKGQYHKNNICHNSRDVYNNHNSKPNNTNTNTHSSPNERVHGPALWVRRFILRSRKMLSWLLPLLVGGSSFKGLSTGACIQYLSLRLALGYYKLWCNLWYNIHNFI